MRVPRYILLPLFLVLSLVAARADTAPLPPIPSHVFSRHGPVPVFMVKAIVCPDSTGVTPRRVIGCFNGMARTIQIADTLDIRTATFVLEHEICHLAFRDEPLTFDHRADEERVCNALGRYRLWSAEAR